MKRIIAVLALPLLCILAGCTRDPKEVARKYVETGNKYFEKGKLKEASIMYRRALQRNMRDPQAHYRLALVELRLGFLGEARRSLLRATDLDSSNVDALAKLGDVDIEIYDRDPVSLNSYLSDVNDVAKRLLARNPKSFDGLRLSAFVATAHKDIPGAIDKIRLANEVKPDQPNLMLTLVRLLDLNKQTQEAEETAKRVIEAHKDYGPMYDFLYIKYATSNRTADAEQILKKKIANNPKSGSDLIQLAYHYYLTKHPEDMNATLERLTSDAKTFPEGRLLAGDLMMRIGSPDRAVEDYQIGEKQDPKNKIAYYKRELQAFMREGKDAEAEKIVSQILKQNPNDIDTVTMHAALLTKSKDPKQIQRAIDEMQRLAASTPSTRIPELQAIHYNLARAFEAKGDPASMDQARLQFEESLKISKAGYSAAELGLAELLLSRGENARAVQEADKVLAKIPQNLAAHLVRTKGLMNMGERDKARQELMALQQAYPRSGDVRYQIALLDLIEQKYKEAEAGFRTLMDARDSRGLQGMIESKTRENDFNAAIALVQSQIHDAPNNLELQRQLASLDIRAKRVNDAIGEYQQIVQKEPNGDNYRSLGECQQIAGQLDAALASYKKASQIQPNDAMPLLRMAIIYENSGRSDDARKAYEQVLKIQPDNPYALNNIAYVKADQGIDLDQALTYAERARQKLPDDPSVSDTVGLIYLRKNLVEDSVRVLSELVSRVPGRSVYHIHYAAALLQKGDKTAAGKELDAASRTGPTQQEKTEIQELRHKLST